MADTPYLSLVTVSRNDNYGGGDILFRMNKFIETFTYLAELHGLDSELLFVDWNPPEDEPPLQEALKTSQISDNTDVDLRFITIPPNIHNSFSNSNELPLFEYIGKNVGIRRSKGKYVLATNPDLIYNEELVKFFSNNFFKPNNFYRVTRYDVAKPVEKNFSPVTTIKYCKENARIANKPNGSHLVNAGFFEKITYRLKNILYRYKINPKKILYDVGLFERSVYDLHHSAVGDFLLTHKKNWEKIRGYPEDEVNFHVDTLALIKLAANGLSQKVLPDAMRIYHQPHRTKHDVRPRLFDSWSKLVDKSVDILNGETSSVRNGEDWGLKDERLSEHEVN